MPGRGSRATRSAWAVIRSTMRARNHQCSSASESPKSARLSEPLGLQRSQDAVRVGGGGEHDRDVELAGDPRGGQRPDVGHPQVDGVDVAARAQHPPQPALDLDPVRPGAAHVDAAGRSVGDGRRPLADAGDRPAAVQRVRRPTPPDGDDLVDVVVGGELGGQQPQQRGDAAVVPGAGPGPSGAEVGVEEQLGDAQPGPGPARRPDAERGPVHQGEERVDGERRRRRRSGRRARRCRPERSPSAPMAARRTSGPSACRGRRTRGARSPARPGTRPSVSTSRRRAPGGGDTRQQLGDRPPDAGAVVGRPAAERALGQHPGEAAAGDDVGQRRHRRPVAGAGRERPRGVLGDVPRVGARAARSGPRPRPGRGRRSMAWTAAMASSWSVGLVDVVEEQLEAVVGIGRPCRPGGPAPRRPAGRGRGRPGAHGVEGAAERVVAERHVDRSAPARRRRMTVGARIHPFG